jgi:hypothetical protein
MSVVSRCILLVMAALIASSGSHAAFAQATNPAPKAKAAKTAQPSIAITNGTDSFVEQFLLAPNGSKSHHSELAPGAVAHVSSKPGDQWTFEISGQTIGQYTTGAAPKQSYKVMGSVNPGDEAPTSARK